VLPRLRKSVPIDALWWASADPATLLFTRSYREELPETSGPYFVDNEFLHKDVNKWTELARDATGVGTLMQATGGHPASSDRYLERMGLLRQACHTDHARDGPGLVVLAADGVVTGLNEAAGQWLEDLGGQADRSDLPIEISAIATRLRHLPPAGPAMPRLRVRTRSGRWAVLHASWMSSQGREGDDRDRAGSSPGRGRAADHGGLRPD
jgi:hypothetical protein